MSNPKARSYKDYAGRGLTLEPKWLTFDGFLADMGEAPDNHTIERKDNNLGYSKENCVWATMATQAKNRRNNIKILHKGEVLILKDAAKLAGIHYQTLYGRLHRSGMSVPKAFRSEDFQAG
jgi:hypothetical protein